MVTILTDEMLDRLPAMPAALEAVGRALAARTAGTLVSPPRHVVDLPPLGNLIFTIGGSTDEEPLAGFRVYHTFPGDDDQLVAVWSPASGRLIGLVVGTRLGEIRTGAIGGIAIRHMSNPNATQVGIIGAGRQARAQLEAAALVRSLRHVRVYSRNEENRRHFAQQMSDRLGIEVLPADSAHKAIDGADIVICATDSALPVFDAAWLKPGAHVNTVGPKTVLAHELAPEISARAQVIATDSAEQTLAYRDPFFLHHVQAEGRLIDLAAIVAGAQRGRTSAESITLFCSAGLAATEVFVASAVLALRDRSR